MHLMAPTELSQLCNPFWVVGKTRSCPITANTGIQRLRRNIHSTNHLLGSTIGYGCLVTVTCLVRSTGSQATVRSRVTNGGGPKRSTAVVAGGTTGAVHHARDPIALGSRATTFSHQMPPLSRYKGPAVSFAAQNLFQRYWL